MYHLMDQRCCRMLWIQESIVAISNSSVSLHSLKCSMKHEPYVIPQNVLEKSQKVLVISYCLIRDNSLQKLSSCHFGSPMWP